MRAGLSVSGPLAYPYLVCGLLLDHLDVARLDADSAFDARRDDRALEHQLGESPLLAVLAHAHDHPLRAAPDALARRLEPPGGQLADLVRDGFRGRLRRRPDDGLVLLGMRARQDAQGGLAGAGLLEGESEQLRALLLLEKGAGDARRVMGPADAVGAVRLGVRGCVGAFGKRLAAERCDAA